mgnify:CR=1 FL=1
MNKVFLIESFSAGLPTLVERASRRYCRDENNDRHDNLEALLILANFEIFKSDIY